jgi:hypothetical protein
MRRCRKDDAAAPDSKPAALGPDIAQSATGTLAAMLKKRNQYVLTMYAPLGDFLLSRNDASGFCGGAHGVMPVRGMSSVHGVRLFGADVSIWDGGLVRY